MLNMKNFELKSLPQEQLVAFYGLTFAAASSDNSISKEELQAIYENMNLDLLDNKNKAIVQSYLIDPPRIEDSIKELSNANDELRYAIIVGISEVILSDDIIEPEEKEFLNNICNSLNVSEEQKEAILHFVKEGRRIIREGIDDNTAEKIIKSAASGLTAVGVPIAAVYFSGTVIGLSAAGITSGLAALGLSLGMVSGIGVAVIIGTGIFIGMKFILGDSKTKKEKELRQKKERKAQLVIKNLQESINNLIDRINDLEKNANTAEANKRAIKELQQRLLALQKILKQRKAIKQ